MKDLFDHRRFLEKPNPDKFGGFRGTFAWAIDGEADFWQETSGGNLGVQYIDTGLGVLITTEEGRVDVGLSGWIRASFDRETGVLTGLLFSLTRGLIEADKRGFVTSQSNLAEARILAKEDVDFEVELKLLAEVPVLEFSEARGGRVVKRYGSLDLQFNPVGIVGGEEYLFKLRGGTCFRDVFLEIEVKEGDLRFAFINEREERSLFGVSRFINPDLFRPDERWDMDKLKNVLANVFPELMGTDHDS